MDFLDIESNDNFKDRVVRLFGQMIHWFVSRGGKHLECERRCVELCFRLKYLLTSSIF